MDNGKGTPATDTDTVVTDPSARPATWPATGPTLGLKEAKEIVDEMYTDAARQDRTLNRIDIIKLIRHIHAKGFEAGERSMSEVGADGMTSRERLAQHDVTMANREATYWVESFNAAERKLKAAMNQLAVAEFALLSANSRLNAKDRALMAMTASVRGASDAVAHLSADDYDVAVARDELNKRLGESVAVYKD